MEELNFDLLFLMIFYMLSINLLKLRQITCYEKISDSTQIWMSIVFALVVVFIARISV